MPILKLEQSVIAGSGTSSCCLVSREGNVQSNMTNMQSGSCDSHMQLHREKNKSSTMITIDRGLGGGVGWGVVPCVLQQSTQNSRTSSYMILGGKQMNSMKTISDLFIKWLQYAFSLVGNWAWLLSVMPV